MSIDPIHRTRRARRSAIRTAGLYRPLLSTLGLALLFCYGRAHSGTIDFSSPTNGNLATPSNWQGGVVPGSADTASFGAGITPNLTLQNTSLTLQGMVFTPTSSVTGLMLSSTGSSAASLTLGNLSNNSAQTTSIILSAPNTTLNLSGTAAVIAGSVQIQNTTLYAQTNFLPGSSAGSAGISNTNGGSTTFVGSTADTSSITIAATSNVNFSGGATAATSTIDLAVYGTLGFSDTSTAGSARISNLGEVVFAGSASAGTATITNSGTVFVANSGTLGESNITNSGSIQITQSASAGAGTISNLSSGTLSFTGASDASTARILNAGGIDLTSMQADLSIGSLNGSGTLSLGTYSVSLGALSLNDSFSGVISGSGGLNKTGTGTLVLSGMNTYTGPTSINSGTLQIDGSVMSAVTVAAQATLSGQGSTSSNVNVLANGTLAPGAAGSVFKLGGNLSLSPHAVLLTTVTPQGQSSQVAVTGSANIAGSTLRVGAGGTAADYASSTSYPVLTAQQGVSGEFAQVSTNLALLLPEAHYAPNSVSVTFDQLPASGGSSATGVDAILSSGITSASTGRLISGLDQVSSSEIAQVLSSLGASNYSALRAINLQEASDFSQKVANHSFAPSAEANAVSAGWIQIQASKHDDALGGDEISRDESGLIGGIDLYRDAKQSISLAGQALSGSISFGNGSNATSSRFDLGIVATTLQGPIELTGIVSYGQHSDDVHRFIDFGNYVQGPSSRPDGYDFSGYGEIATRYNADQYVLTPYAALQWTMANDNDFQESGGSATDLLGYARRQNLMSSSAGIRVSSPSTANPGWLGVGKTGFSFGLAWIHDAGCLDGRVDASFLADSSHTQFFSTAMPSGHDYATLNLTLNSDWRSGWHAQLRLIGESGSNSHAVGAYAGISYDLN